MSKLPGMLKNYDSNSLHTKSWHERQKRKLFIKKMPFFDFYNDYLLSPVVLMKFVNSQESIYPTMTTLGFLDVSDYLLSCCSCFISAVPFTAIP